MVRLKTASVLGYALALVLAACGSGDSGPATPPINDRDAETVSRAAGEIQSQLGDEYFFEMKHESPRLYEKPIARLETALGDEDPDAPIPRALTIGPSEGTFTVREYLDGTADFFEDAYPKLAERIRRIGS